MEILQILVSTGLAIILFSKKNKILIFNIELLSQHGFSLGYLRH